MVFTEGMDQWHYEWWQGRGDKPVILFLHGFMGSCEDWKEVSSLLRSRFSTLAVDLPGHGRTRIEGGDEGYTMPATSVSILRILDRLGIERCCLVSYSMGGRLALYLALRHQDRFSRVVLESASPGIEGAQERAERMRRDEGLAKELEEGEFPPFLDRWYNQSIFGFLRAHPSFHRLLKRRMRNDPVLLAKSLRSMGAGAQPSLWEHLQGNRIPLLLLAGERDEKFRAIAQRMEAACPCARLKVISGCGHCIHCENPEEFAKQVEGFFLQPSCVTERGDL